MAELGGEPGITKCQACVVGTVNPERDEEHNRYSSSKMLLFLRISHSSPRPAISCRMRSSDLEDQLIVGLLLRISCGVVLPSPCRSSPVLSIHVTQLWLDDVVKRRCSGKPLPLSFYQASSGVNHCTLHILAKPTWLLSSSFYH